MPDSDTRPIDDIAYPGEPGIETEARPPFIAENPDAAWLFALNRKGIRPGLGRVRGLLEHLGHPENELRTIVTAGTNGKGSTTRILARLLQDAGYRVACYTSPHLLRVYERLTIDDRPIEPDAFTGMIRRLKPAIEEHQASWFESLTAISVGLCRDLGVDILCCETGLGGRLDASNALPPVATLLTGVSLDHQHILGETREEIAAEKLGLLKTGVPVFTAVDDALRGQVFEAAVRAGAPCRFLDELTRIGDADRGGGWRLTTRSGVYDGLPDPGAPIMRRNAALAILALEELSGAGDYALPVDVPASLRRVFLPGRFQRVLRDPDILIDTAHNREALAGTLETFLARPVSGRRIVLFGGMADKDPGAETGALLGRCDRVFAAPVSLPRSRNRSGLRSLMEGWGVTERTAVSIHASVAGALRRLADDLEPDDAVLVCGSCFLVAETLYELGIRDLEETRRIETATDRLSALERGNDR